MSMARMCGMDAGRIVLVTLQASQLRSGKRIRSGMLKALACGMTDRTAFASPSSSASPLGISSTEILIRANLIGTDRGDKDRFRPTTAEPADVNATGNWGRCAAAK